MRPYAQKQQEAKDDGDVSEIRCFVKKPIRERIKAAMQGRTYEAYMLSVEYIMKSQPYITAVINDNLSHMAIDLPSELYPIPSILRVIGLKAQNLSDSERDAFLEDLALYAQNWKRKTHIANVGDFQVVVPGEKVEE